jgi:hypothetical protein
MNAGASRTIQQLLMAFAVAFIAVSALALLVDRVWLRFLPMTRIDSWALGLSVVTVILCLLVFVGAFYGGRHSSTATVRAARWAGIIVAVPLVVGFEIVEFWSTFIGPAPWLIFIAMVLWCVGAPWYFMRANSALLTDAYLALRASSGAAKRER